MSNDLAILSSHLSTLIEARSVSPNDLDPLVGYAIQETQDERSLDTRKAQWELLLKGEVFRLAATEGDALRDHNTSYYDELRSRLDMVLAFTEHGACDPSFPFSVLGDLLETQTVSSCWHIFSWMEERTEKLTADMTATKTKPLILLRMLNDLLRRLSKTGKNTMFCGRILNFLSCVFPLGERSGVNLRGDYGTLWDGPGSKNILSGEEKKKDVEGSDVDMENGEKRATLEEIKKEEFYQTFWSLQIPFSRPPLFARNIFPFQSFRKGVDMVLPVISEATKKERAMMGSKGVGGNLKRKRDDLDGNGSANVNGTHSSSGGDYFFAKFLTSPELLDLEIADTNFRRQFLFQLLILLQHLLQFIASERPKWATAKNRSLQMDFTLDAADEKWCQDTWTRVMEEMRATTPGGKNVAETVGVILEREKNWIWWKNDLCPPFDKEPLQPALEEQTKQKRETMIQPQPAWRYRWGTEAITELWETGFHGLRDCEDIVGPGDAKDFAKRIKQVEMRMEMRRKQLVRLKPPPPQPTPPPPLPPPAATESQGETQEQTPSQASAPASISVPTTSAPTPTTQGPSIPLHPSLPPRPITSPAPKPNLRNQNVTQPAGPTQQGSTAIAPTAPPSIQVAAGDQTKVAPASVPETPKDPQLTELEEQKDRLSWLSLRRTRSDYLHLFGGFGATGVNGLVEAIEMEKAQEKDKGKANEDEKEAAQPVKMDIDIVTESANEPLRAAKSTENAAADAAKAEVKPNSMTATPSNNIEQAPPADETSTKMEVGPA